MSSIHTAQSEATQTLRVMHANYVNVLYGVCECKRILCRNVSHFFRLNSRPFVPSSDTKTHLCTGEKLRRQMCTISWFVNKVLEIICAFLSETRAKCIHGMEGASLLSPPSRGISNQHIFTFSAFEDCAIRKPKGSCWEQSPLQSTRSQLIFFAHNFHWKSYVA